MRGVAAFTGSTEPRFAELPDPAEPGPGQVLCRTLELGICGTDREILHSQAPYCPARDGFLVLGHECLARVEAIGPDVTTLAEGDLVVPVVRRAPRHEWRRVDMLPFGTFTERGIVHEHGFSAPRWLDEPRHLHQVWPRLAPVAVLTEPLAVAEKGVHEAVAVQRGRLGASAWTETETASPPRVLVTGMGPIGFAAALVTRARGWTTTLYGRDEPESSRAELVREIGATYLHQRDAGFPPRDVEADGYDLILECTGSEIVILETAGALAAGGVMVWLGSSRRPEPGTHNVARLVRDGLLRNHIYLGCVNAAPRDFQQSLADLRWWQSHNPGALERLVTARVEPDESLWHFANRQPQGIKTVVVYETP